MDRSSASQRRLIADVQRLLSTLLAREVSDPRVEGVCITRVASTGRHNLTVFVHRTPTGDIDSCMSALGRMTPHFEHELRRAIPRRRIPSIRFAWDEAFDKGGEVMAMLARLERP
ncbi:MAG: ribosome-binding factor A [Mariprofundaceae bacterium]